MNCRLEDGVIKYVVMTEDYSDKDEEFVVYLVVSASLHILCVCTHINSILFRLLLRVANALLLSL